MLAPMTFETTFSMRINMLIRKMSNLTGKQKELMARGLPKKTAIPGVKNIILVASGKGGVGKSTTAVNLAMAISRHGMGFDVGILDADIYGPSIPKMMNLEKNNEPFVNKNNMMLPLVNYGVKCMSIGFLVDANEAIVWRGPMIMSAVQKMIREVDWNPLDYLIIDMPPGTGDIQLSLSQLLPVTAAVIVTTPQDVALIDARRGAEMFRKVQIPIAGLVQNMSQFVCPNCNHISHIFGEDGAKKLCNDIDVEILGDIPLHLSVRETCDNGLPIVIADASSQQTAAFTDIAKKIIDKFPIT